MILSSHMEAIASVAAAGIGLAGTLGIYAATRRRDDAKYLAQRLKDVTTNELRERIAKFRQGDLSCITSDTEMQLLCVALLTPFQDAAETISSNPREWHRSLNSEWRPIVNGLILASSPLLKIIRQTTIEIDKRVYDSPDRRYAYEELLRAMNFRLERPFAPRCKSKFQQMTI